MALIDKRLNPDDAATKLYKAAYLAAAKVPTDVNQAKAKELYAQAAKIVAEQAFYIFVQYQEYIQMHRPDLKGLVMNPVENFSTIKDVTIGQ